MYEKPITENMKKKCKIIYDYMKEKQTYCTKQELMDLLDTGERQVRDVISTLSQHKPIIATSDRKGYKLAMFVSDLDEVEHTMDEIQSRIEELQKKITPLMKWRELARQRVGYYKK